MTEEQIKQYGDMIRRLVSPFDIPFTGGGRYIQTGDAEYAARAVEAILREQQTKHQEQLEAIRDKLYWLGVSVAEANSRHAQIAKLLAAE